ncbi:hypothetical protein R3P38DRAFT_3212828 [Favolaschia claudopus]|uniref:DUF6589 domain-containing protein n=1 Tax=Favolaschia claudopus TaxID=2862362 RepID=A0AAW0ADU4_9AGAR
MTSIALNIRSRRSNLHQVINGFIFWDNKMPKRLVQMMNHLGVCTSYQSRTEAISYVSKDSVSLAQSVATDPTKLKMLPYDNFNWVSHVYESSAMHRKVTHDQVSAFLVVVNVPDNAQTLPAEDLASIQRFEAVGGARHRLLPQKSLEEILPSRDDQIAFRNICIKHIGYILCDEIPKQFLLISLNSTKYLPTYDQEQGSTRGNMLVLRHYLLDVLRIPKEAFERIMFSVPGDRLTTARDRAAQDQRALDPSQHRADYPVSLMSDFEAFQILCTSIADKFVLPSVDRLEAEGIKTLRGNSVSGNAVLLAHDLMTLREMRNAIKHGHPSRVRRMLKYWAPMFYAGGSYNYAHETMELLHNIIHDWPSQTAEILEAGMIFNTQGDRDTHLEGDLCVEHFNDVIKEHVKDVHKDLGVEEVNQHHAKVRQHKDVEILTGYFTSSDLFEFNKDKVSEQTVIDLYRHGLHRLAGTKGGHARHFARHKLRFRTRHDASETLDANMLSLYQGDRELKEGADSERGMI